MSETIFTPGPWIDLVKIAEALERKSLVIEAAFRREYGTESELYVDMLRLIALNKAALRKARGENETQS